MQNPFVYGEVVPAAAFVDRADELDRLIGDLASGQKIFLISPRRYGKSSLIRQALDAMRRRGALTVSVTVSSFSSYVAFLEGYARALVAAETPSDRARAWLRRRGPVGARRDPLRAGRLAARRPHRLLPRRAVRPRHLPARRGGLRAARPAGRGAAQADRDRARRVPGDRRLQRRLGRARPARRRPAPARGRLRLRRLGAEPHGADARAEAAVLQGGAGHAAREDPGRRLRRLHRGPVRQVRHPRRGRPRRGRRRAGRQPAVRRAAARARDVGRGARRREASARRSTICTPPSAGSSPSSRRCSRRSGSG